MWATQHFDARDIIEIEHRTLRPVEIDIIDRDIRHEKIDIRDIDGAQLFQLIAGKGAHRNRHIDQRLLAPAGGDHDFLDREFRRLRLAFRRLGLLKQRGIGPGGGGVDQP